MANGSGSDFERLARQYWGAWGDAMRGNVPGGGQPGMQAWHDAVDWWTRYAHGGRGEVNDVLQRFNAQAHNWYGQMQQVAAQFAGRESTAAEITDAWKRALGAVGVNPFPEMLRSMRGHGLQGLDQWVEDASPYLDAMRSEGLSWLRMPAFGFAREHQERLQALAEAQVEYQERNSAYNALMLKASQSAFEIFEDKLLEHEEPGRQIDSPRQLFDLWIDAAEEAYAEIALSKEFREVYGKLVDAQMRLRAGIQREVEQIGAMFDMPTRTELDATHRKIVELERAVRRMRDAAEAPPAASPAASAGPRANAAKKGRRKPAARRASAPAAKSVEKPDKKPEEKPARKSASAPRKRSARKVASRPSVASRRAPTNGFSTAIPMPVAPLPMDDAPTGQEG